MAAGTYHFTGTTALKKGATFNRSFVWKNADKTAVNLEGFTAYMQVRKKAGGDLLIEFSTDNNSITLEEDTGRITLRLEASATVDLPVGDFLYDLFMVSEADSNDTEPYREPLLEGKFSIVDRVTVI